MLTDWTTMLDTVFLLSGILLVGVFAFWAIREWRATVQLVRRRQRTHASRPGLRRVPSETRLERTSLISEDRWVATLEALLSGNALVPTSFSDLGEYVLSIVPASHDGGAHNTMHHALDTLLERWASACWRDEDYCTRMFSLIKAAPSATAISAVSAFLTHLTPRLAQALSEGRTSLSNAALDALDAMNFPGASVCTRAPELHTQYLACMQRLFRFDPIGERAFRQLLPHVSEDELVFSIRVALEYDHFEPRQIYLLLDEFFEVPDRARNLLLSVLRYIAVSASGYQAAGRVLRDFPGLAAQLETAARTPDEQAAVMTLRDSTEALASLLK